jgi:hypothetical protein
MREQRALLRERGMSFAQDRSGHSYSNSLKIGVDNVITPGISSVVRVAVSSLVKDRTEVWNSDNSAGVVVVRTDSKLIFYPAFCMHEGAPLLHARCDEDFRLECPWHGRRLPPIGQISLELLESNAILSVDYRLKEISVIKE